MVTIPLSYLLIPYFIGVLLFFIFLGINIYHLAISASITPKSITVTGLVCLMALVTFYLTWFFLRDIPWQESITLFDTTWFSPPSSF